MNIFSFFKPINDEEKEKESLQGNEYLYQFGMNKKRKRKIVFPFFIKATGKNIYDYNNNNESENKKEIEYIKNLHENDLKCCYIESCIVRIVENTFPVDIGIDISHIVSKDYTCPCNNHNQQKECSRFQNQKYSFVLFENIELPFEEQIMDAEIKTAWRYQHELFEEYGCIHKDEIQKGLENCFDKEGKMDSPMCMVSEWHIIYDYYAKNKKSFSHYKKDIKKHKNDTIMGKIPITTIDIPCNMLSIQTEIHLPLILI